MKIAAEVIVGCLLGAVGCGSTGPAGPAGPPGQPGAGSDAGAAASAGLITPYLGLLDRTLDVTVSGQNMGFDKTAPTFNFGMNVTVSNVQVIDPDSAVATVQIDPTATIGPRDVTITAGTATLTATKGFDVEPPLDVSIDQSMGMNLGQAQQGGIAIVTMHNIDAENAVASDFLYLTAGSSVWTQNVRGDDSGTQLLEAIVFDPLGAPGAVQMQLANPGFDGTPSVTFYGSPSALTVAAQTPTSLTAGTDQNDSLMAQGGSKFYELTTTTPALVSFNAIPSDDTQLITPRIRIYGNDGMSDTIIDDEGGESIFGATPAQSTFPLATAGNLYLVLADAQFGGGTGYSYTLTPTVTTVANVIASPATAHGTPATAPDETSQCVPGPCIITGNLTTAGQIDAYQLTLAANAIVTVNLVTSTNCEALVDLPAGATFSNADTFALNTANGSNYTAALLQSGSGQATTAGAWYLIVIGETGGSNPTGAYSVSVQTM